MCRVQDGSWTRPRLSVRLRSSDAVGELLLLDLVKQDKAEWVATLWKVTNLASQRRCSILTGARWRLVRDLHLVVLRYFDSAWYELAQEECDWIIKICKLQGVGVNPKSQAGQARISLGILFLFKGKKLAIDYQREMRGVLASDPLSLSQGQAAKPLKPPRTSQTAGEPSRRPPRPRKPGGHGSGGLTRKAQREAAVHLRHLTGRDGRAFLGPLEGRQYASNQSFSWSSSLLRVHHIESWDTQLDASDAVPSDTVPYTDHSFPDGHRDQKRDNSPASHWVDGLHQGSNGVVGTKSSSVRWLSLHP